MDLDLAARLRSRSWSVAKKAWDEARSHGDSGDLALGELLDEVALNRRVLLVAKLGARKAPGPADDSLRRCLDAQGRGSRDLRCAALVALANRLGSEATRDLLRGLDQKDRVVVGYALLCLDRRGGGAGWDRVLAWLIASRARSDNAGCIPGGARPPEHHALAYLLRTLPAGRHPELAEVIRHSWDHLPTADKSRLRAVWPQVLPDGPVAPGPPLAKELELGTGPGRPLFD